MAWSMLRWNRSLWTWANLFLTAGFIREVVWDANLRWCDVIGPCKFIVTGTLLSLWVHPVTGCFQTLNVIPIAGEAGWKCVTLRCQILFVVCHADFRNTQQDVKSWDMPKSFTWSWRSWGAGISAEWLIQRWTLTWWIASRKCSDPTRWAHLKQVR